MLQNCEPPFHRPFSVSPRLFIPLSPRLRVSALTLVCYVLGITGLAGLAGCAVGPDFHSPKMLVPPVWRGAHAPADKQPSATAADTSVDDLQPNGVGRLVAGL